MAKPLFQAIRGMNDILPDESALWQYLETTIREVLAGYSYQEIRLPLVERTELFARSIGEITDIVEKEMYTFDDRNGESLTLRPEGTAGCVRACIEHGLLYNQTQRLWYAGPMFRYEKPQKGRYRQFHQIGVEAYGITDPGIDAELICLSSRLWQQLKLGDISLQINSLGSSAARAAYREKLVAYFNTRYDDLDGDSQRRLHTNPLRILDSKNPEMREVITEAPLLLDHLDPESADHFDTLKTLLDTVGITYEINPRLVRGLDYYCKTVFEWVTSNLGAQGTICAGGRYDGLIPQLGGQTTPAIGFAMGLERLIALLPDTADLPNHDPDIYLVLAGDAAQIAGLMLAERLRDQLPHLQLRMNCGGGSFKAQLRRADNSGARFALILGDDEVKAGTVAVKSLRATQSQQVTLPQNQIAAHLHKVMSE